MDGNIISYSTDRLFNLYSESNELLLIKDISLVSAFNKKFSIVLPTREKFKNTVLNRTYYDLLRFFANELDKENTLLITEGFSLNDEHILELVKTALKNPTLDLVIFCFSKKDLEHGLNNFKSYNNVKLIYSESKRISFSLFNNLLEDIITC